MMGNESEQKHIYNVSVSEALESFESRREGLTTEEAVARQKQYGLNKTNVANLIERHKLLWPLATLYVSVLLVVLGISAARHRYVEAAVILAIMTLNAALYGMRRFSVSRTLRALRKLEGGTTYVRRDGDTVEIDSTYVTYGDIVHLFTGSRVPADGRIIDASDLTVNESIVTGETETVHKHAAAADGLREINMQDNMLFRGTHVHSGSALMLVTGIGNETQFAEISRLAAKTKPNKLYTWHKVDNFLRKVVAFAAIAAIVILNLAVYRGLTYEDALRFSAAILLTAIPVGLPLALTLASLRAARRLSRMNIYVKRLAGLEALGFTTVIAADKTNIISQNRLSVNEKHTTHTTDSTFNEVIRASINGSGDSADDALDQVLHASVLHVHMPTTWHRERDFSFNHRLRVSAVLWKHSGGYSLYVKGAPESVLKFCSIHHQRDEGAMRKVEELSTQGQQVVAFAHINLMSPAHTLQAATLKNLYFDGFVGLSDELQPDAPRAVAHAQAAGIKLIMVTGEHTNTARYVAKQAGIVIRNQDVIGATVLQEANQGTILDSIKDGVRVFGRLLPAHKLNLVKSMSDTEVVAFAGSGLHDIPSLTAADIGISTAAACDAVRDASDIVVANNGLSGVLSAIRAARSYVANIRKMLVYVVATSVAEVLILLAALIFGWPLPLTVLQILWINMVTDGLLLTSLSASPVEKSQSTRVAKSPHAPFISRRQKSWIILLALSTAITVLYVYSGALPKGSTYAQTLALISLVAVQWVNILSVNIEFRSWANNLVVINRKLFGALFVSIGLQVAVLFTALGEYIGLVPVSAEDAFVAVLLPAVVALIASDMHKAVWNILERSGRLPRQAHRATLQKLNNL